MADLINLRQKRKDKKREEKEKQASGNRALFGETKLSKLKREKEKAQIDKSLEGARRNKPDGDLSS